MNQSTKASTGRTPSKDLLLWRRLTLTDFHAMNGQAAPSGSGGGATHIALGVETDAFPIQEFLQTGRTTCTISTQPWPGHHEAARLTFSGNPGRRGGEWRITDQHTHRHPAWSPAAGFPASYDSSDRPCVLLFKVQGRYHARLSTESALLAFGAEAPRRFRSDPKGISEPRPGLLSHFDVPVKTRLEAFEEQQAEAKGAFDPKDVEDARQRVFAAILRRQGQQAFRRKLLQVYGNRCAITGSTTQWVLEAAHITPYRGVRTNSLENGLILRADIHTLFDIGLIAVDPIKLTVKVSSLLAGTEYAALDGKMLAKPAKRSAQPSKAALNEHYNTFRL